MLEPDSHTALTRLAENCATPDDLRALQDAFRTGALSFAAPQGVAIAGSADAATIVTGDGNIVLSLKNAGPGAVQSLLAAVFPSAPHQLRAPPADFTGRTAELADLAAKIQSGSVTITGLRGMGGIGKTALALKLAEQLLPSYPEAQLLIELHGSSSTPLDPTKAMAQVIQAFLPTAKLPGSDEDLAKLYRNVLHNRRAILLFDDVRDAAQIAPLVPPPECQVLVLVTSRQSFTLPGMDVIRLDTLPPADAHALLVKIAPRLQTGDRVPALAQACSYLPLALRLAASALAARPTLSVADYLAQLRDTKVRLKTLEKYRHLTPENLGVEASLDLSYQLLDEPLQTLWRVLAVFPATFAPSAAAAVWETAESEAQEKLGDLHGNSLVEWDAQTDRFHLHDLARDFAQGRLNQDEQFSAHRRHAEHFLHILEKTTHLYSKGGAGVLQGLTLLDLERINIDAGQAWAAVHAEKDTVAARLCCRYPATGVYCLTLRQHPRNETIPWFKAALAAARALKDRKFEAMHLGNLGLVLFDVGDVRQAITFYEQDLAIAREIGDRRGECAVLTNLGSAHRNMGDPHKAIGYHEEALAITRELGDQRGEGTVLGNLGNSFKDLGDTHKSIECQAQALMIARQFGNRLGEGEALGTLGTVFLGLGDTPKAVEYGEQSLFISREIGDKRGEARALSNLGAAYRSLGDSRKALEFYHHALAIAREIGYIRCEGNVLFNIAVVLHGLGDHPSALADIQAALAICEAIEDPHAAIVRRTIETWQQAK